MKNISPLLEQDFKLFQKLLVEESGLFFDRERIQFLKLALWERIQKRGYNSYQEYYHLLKFHPEGRLEIRELIDLITIGETYFFRNNPHFEVLMKFVLPEIIQKKTCKEEMSIRIWSAGCSRGAEPYSLAMAITELLPSYEHWNISILGTDINREALVRARSAVYSNRDLRQLSQDYLDKYFYKRGTNFILNDNVKKMVRFEYHNLAKDFFSLEGMMDLDIIFCRNVTIYFDFDTTRRVINNFYNCIVPDGYLFLGHAETLWQITDRFESINFPQTFIYKKSLVPVKQEELQPFVAVPEFNLEDLIFETERNDDNAVADKIDDKISIEKDIEEPVGEQEIKSKSQLDLSYETAIELFEKKDYDTSFELLNKIIQEDSSYIEAYFVKANILANQAKYEEAFSELNNIIKKDNLYLEAYYLSGVLSYKIGDMEKAEEHFKKVIYIDSTVVIAYYNLGNIYMYQRKFSKADREFNNAIKLLDARPEDEAVRFCEDFTVYFLLRACRNNLTEIERNS